MPFNFVACFVLEIPARSAAVVHRLVVSRICEKRRGRPAGRRFQRRENTKRRVHVLRIESARLAMRAARATARCARRALHPTKQSKIHFCRDPSGGAIGRRTQNNRLLRLERNRRPRNTRCAANQQPSCNTIDFRHWKARTPPPKTAVAHFLRACGVAQRSDFARRREETVNAHDSQHCGRWENIRDRGHPAGGKAKTPGGPTCGRSYTPAPPRYTKRK